MEALPFEVESECLSFHSWILLQFIYLPRRWIFVHWRWYFVMLSKNPVSTLGIR